MIGREVVLFALSVAVAAVVVALAVVMLPSAGQLAYGSSMPVFKVAYSGGAVRVWVEDFGGMSYEQVWLYVNGQLAASGGPGTNATAKCGDEVAAVVKYHSGIKKIDGRILCTKPIKKCLT